jgi:energy-coupling factor transporter ATP-binding protein EcfA2
MSMITKLSIRNFKRFRDVEIELGSPVVFVGPNDSGKTTALQALALWHLGLRRWREKRGDRPVPEKRPGVTINRRDLVAVPVPDANFLWRDRHVRDVRRSATGQETRNVRVDVVVEGVADGKSWTCGLEFDYANEESFYCRPLRRDDEGASRMPIPAGAVVDMAYLPPMSGLAASEVRLDPGAVQVRLGEGRTAEVLRNLCHQVFTRSPSDWSAITDEMQRLFGARPLDPRYVAERGEVLVALRSGRSPAELDLSCSGRGFQQTLLLLAHLAANPGCVLLLDEPDAHLEVLRQRQIYKVLTEAAQRSDSQIIAASHSEVVLNEAADKDVVVAFVGRPHRIDDRGSQVLKALKEIGYDQYLQAEVTGWVLYLEGPTDLAILQALARRLDHPAAAVLERPFPHWIGNQPQRAREHFHALREAREGLVGYVLCDRLDRQLQSGPGLQERAWRRREIENYLTTPEVLLAWSRAAGAEGPLGGPLGAGDWERVMQDCLAELEQALEVTGKPSPWSPDIKATDEFLDPLFKRFFARVGLPNLFRKTDYHRLVEHLPAAQIDSEVSEVLDGIHAVATAARPGED